VKNTWKGPGTREDLPTGGALLKKPEPITAPTAGETVVPVNLQRPFAEGNGGSGAEQSHDQLLAQLKERGMTGYWEQSQGDGYKFTCTIPRPNSTKIRQLEAIGATPAQAVKAVLDQVSRD
jgi:hypothetical protein